MATDGTTRPVHSLWTTCGETPSFLCGLCAQPVDQPTRVGDSAVSYRVIGRPRAVDNRKTAEFGCDTYDMGRRNRLKRTTAAAGTRAARPLWRNWDFQLLFAGSLTSVIGSEVSAIAYPLLVLAVTGSPAQAGVVAFAETAASVLLGLPAGALVDR